MNTKKNRRIIATIFTTIYTIMLYGCIAYADAANFGENTKTWLMTQIGALATVIVAGFCIKFLVKKAWAQLIGYALLAGLVLMIIASPSTLQNLAQTIYNKIIGAA